MTARIIDGTAVAREVYAGIGQRVQKLAGRGIQPGLAAVRFGDNAASEIYLRNKVRACTAAGLHSEVHELAADCGEQLALDAEVRDLKVGLDAVEERARSELGMVKQNEIFFQILEARPADPGPSAPR